MSGKKEVLIVRGRVSDLWREAEGGWYENASWSRSCELRFPVNVSDATIARAVKKALEIRYMRPDSWCGADFCWRDGCIGAYADCEVITVDE